MMRLKTLLELVAIIHKVIKELLKNMLILCGTHGTSVSRAEKIKNEGFRLFPGRRGTGTYFWRKGEYSRLLSVAWWDQCCKRGIYGNDKHQKCAVIYAEFHIRNEEYCDISTFEVKERIAKIIESKQIDKKNPKKLAALYDYAIALFEKKNNVRLKVVESLVSVPKSKICDRYPLIALGYPHCYAVRVPDCITIKFCEENAQ